MNEKCLIMMTSYNGEKYIAEQIESIRQQTYTNWELIIQDDCSTDNTVKIIESFIKKDNRICFQINNGKHGAYPNWHSLINYCKTLDLYEYYFFCDHDDIWKVNKLDKMIKYYKKKSSDKIPTLIYADMEVIDGEGKLIADNFAVMSGQVLHHSYDTFYKSSIYGCNVFFNQALFKIVPEVNPEDIRPHDAYYGMFAAATGKLFHMPFITMQYRRHGSNASNTPDNFGWKRIRKRIGNLEELAKDHAYNYEQALYVFRMIKENKIILNDPVLIKQIEKSIKNGGWKGLYTFLKLHVNCGNKYRTLSRAIILLFGNYKKFI